MKTIDVSKIDIFEITNPKLQLILICLFTDGYVEPDGTIRLYFTLEQVQTKLHRSRQSATRIFRELEYSGLIVRRKQGLGKPALITLNYPADAKLIAKEGEDAQA